MKLELKYLKLILDNHTTGKCILEPFVIEFLEKRIKEIEKELDILSK